MIGRREFVSLLGDTTVAWPLTARAQPAGKRPIIGFLGTDAVAWRPWIDAFVERLRELGWIEGRTIAFEYRWFEGRPERNTEIAAEFIRLKVDVILTNATGRGRDRDFSPPPAQIPAGAANAPGSHLGW